jgi:hypothetical protein
LWRAVILVRFLGWSSLTQKWVIYLVAPSFTLLTKLTVHCVRNVLVVVAAAAAELLHKVAFDADRRGITRLDNTGEQQMLKSTIILFSFPMPRYGIISFIRPRLN